MIMIWTLTDLTTAIKLCITYIKADYGSDWMEKIHAYANWVDFEIWNFFLSVLKQLRMIPKEKFI